MSMEARFRPASARSHARRWGVRWLLTAVLVLTTCTIFPLFGAQPGATGPVLQVNTYTTSRQTEASIASDSAGNSIVVWTGNLEDGAGYGVFGRRFDSSGLQVGSSR